MTARIILRVPADTLLHALPAAQQAAIAAFTPELMPAIKCGTVVNEGRKLVDALIRAPLTAADLAAAGLNGWEIVYQAEATGDGTPPDCLRPVVVLVPLFAAAFRAHLPAPVDETGAPTGEAPALADPSTFAGWPPCVEAGA